MKNETRDMDYIDNLLKKALKSAETPDEELVQKVKNELIKRDFVMKKNNIVKHSFRVVAVVVISLLLATTAFAAWYINFLKPSEVAGAISDELLSAAFDSKDAVNINASVTSGDYTFTLLAVVTGKDITSMPYIVDGCELHNDRTYVILAIQNADGTPITKEIYNTDVSFFTSPLVKGLKPWLVNIYTMNGGYSEKIVDGVLYRIVECNTVEMFADRGLYFAVRTGTFYSTDAFTYDEQTGEITANPNYVGSNAIFDLPIDKSLADPEKAEQYLNGIDYYSVPSDEDNENVVVESVNDNIVLIPKN